MLQESAQVILLNFLLGTKQTEHKSHHWSQSTIVGYLSHGFWVSEEQYAKANVVVKAQSLQKS